MTFVIQALFKLPKQCNSRHCSFTGPPWFYKQLPHRTTDDLEMRVYGTDMNANILVEVAEIYVQ